MEKSTLTHNQTSDWLRAKRGTAAHLMLIQSLSHPLDHRNPLAGIASGHCHWMLEVTEG